MATTNDADFDDTTARRNLLDSIKRLGSHVAENVLKVLIKKLKQHQKRLRNAEKCQRLKTSSCTTYHRNLSLSCNAASIRRKPSKRRMDAIAVDDLIDAAEQVFYYENEGLSGCNRSRTGSFDSISSSENSYCDFLDYCYLIDSQQHQQYREMNYYNQQNGASKSGNVFESRHGTENFEVKERPLRRRSCGDTPCTSWEDSSSFFSRWRDTSLNNTDKVTKLRQSRLMQASNGSNLDGSETSVTNSIEAFEEQFRSTRQQSALLFVDISGFTALATSLEIEEFSKVINNYFQLIVDEIELFGGDVLKFAGDALIVEWQVSTLCRVNRRRRRNSVDFIRAHESLEIDKLEDIFSCILEMVLIASLCACSIVEKFSDFTVSSNNKVVSNLNLHCGIGFGDAVGLHVGNRDRMEHLVLGDSIRQCSQAANIAKDGEVAVSPKVLEILEKIVVYKKPIDMRLPQIIASRSDRFFEQKRTGIYFQPPASNFVQRIASRCTELDTLSLENLQSQLIPFVHPVFLLDHSLDTYYKGTADEVIRTSTQLHQSRAELRDVFTLFIQPDICPILSGEEKNDVKLCELLNQVMVLVNGEIIRFQGQLRQFIVDDKGLVIIVNFGLRGSTFPNMIDERALPCMKTVKILLKTELDIESKMGATYGKAYCGVVGATQRYEYAVLGPSVNLAARLMAHPDNPGILIDNEVMRKAKSYQAESLPSIKAKGYRQPVKIFKPSDDLIKKFKQGRSVFVGRQEEIALLSELANSSSVDDLPKIVLITGQYGVGKSALMSHATGQIKNEFESHCTRCNTFYHKFCDSDSFRPFSIVRPLFLNLLLDNQKIDESLIDLSDADIRQAREAHLYKLCLRCGIPGRWMELLGCLTFSNKLSHIGWWSDQSHKMSEWNKLAMFVVQLFKQCFDGKELVLLALDDVSAMDEMSWKVISLLYEHARNLLIIGASRNYLDMNIHPEFLEELVEEDIICGRFVRLQLSPFNKDEVRILAQTILRGSKSKDFSSFDDESRIVSTVFSQSLGNPLLASEILEKLYSEKDWFTASEIGNIADLLLNRVDSLSPVTRSYLNLAAILGDSFKLSDVGTIMSRYQELKDHELQSSKDKVQKGLDEAVEFAILQVDEDNTYHFAHRFWRDSLLKYTLDEWKNEMRNLIDEVKIGNLDV